MPACPDPSFTLVLASGSPRRLELLQQLGYQPQCYPVNVDESPLVQETPEELVRRLAIAKAARCAELLDAGIQTEQQSAVANHPGRHLIVGADTVIDMNGVIIGKPRNRDHCLQTLQRLSGQKHRVHTGVCVWNTCDLTKRTQTVTSEVSLRVIDPQEARVYWDTGEPDGKAGSYAIQGLGAVFVSGIAGSYSNVVGLPLFETAALLAKAGLPVLAETLTN